MSSPIVIFRTVSVEKMSPVLNACQERWLDHPIWIVTSRNRVEEMERDVRVERSIPFDGAMGFERPFSLDAKAEAVVVPTANKWATGYGNVLNAALGVDASTYYICSRCRTLLAFGKSGFMWRARRERFLIGLARVFSGFWAERILERDDQT